MAQICVQLSYDEILAGALAGALRHLENLKDGRRNRTHGLKNGDQDWQFHIEGCLGEIALAKAMGLYWSKGKPGADDVGEFQVRTSTRENGHLILHPEDRDHRKFYSVTGRDGTYKIWGWILGADGKKPEYWKDPAGGRPAFFVPRSLLTPP